MPASHQRRKALSQNFLHNPRLVARLVRGSSLGPDDVVIEIGPGNGAITGELVKTCRHVLAIEKDPAYVEKLRRTFGVSRQLTLFGGDFLEFPLPQSRYKVFASIPFGITAAIVGKLTSGTSPPEDMYLVMQQEAAERLLGVPVATLVSAQLGPLFDLSTVHRFQRRDFRPMPGVDSVMLQIRRRPEPLIPIEHRQHYLDFTAALFTAWKPTAREAASAALPRRAFRALDRHMGEALNVKPSRLGANALLEAFAVLVTLDDTRTWNAIAGTQARLDAREAKIEKRTRTTAGAG